MTLRDEIAIALFDAIDDLRISQGRIVADALLPIVERAAREAAVQGWHAHHSADGSCTYIEILNAIVARVMEGGE